MPQKDDRDAPHASTVVDLSEQSDVSKPRWSIDITASDDYVSHFIKRKNETDVFWSVFSNTFFLRGGLFYLLGSSWDVILSKSDNDDVQNIFLYNSIWVLGPFVYLLNSVIDVIWAIRTTQFEKKQRGLKRFFIRAHEHAANVGVEGDTGRDILLALE